MSNHRDYITKTSKTLFVLYIVTFFTIFVSPGFTADVITNGTFDTDLSDWNAQILLTEGTRSWDNVVFGTASGSIKYLTLNGRRFEFQVADSIYIPTVINNTDSVFLSFYWYKYSGIVRAGKTDITVSIVDPNGTEKILWSELSEPAAAAFLDGNVIGLDVTDSLTLTGNYYLKFLVDLTSGNGGYAQINLDDIVLDVRTPVVNEPPVVTDIPDQSISEGSTFTTITLDNYVSDPDNTDAEMTWTYSGNTELIVDITNRIATITTPNADWNGSETITFRATDPGSLWDEDPATFTVTPVNDPPVVTDIPNQSVAEGSSFTTITLDNYVSDVDNTDAEMTWTYTGNTELTVDITSRIATITPPDADWNGSEVITFRATDPGLEFSEDVATFTITPVNDPPVVTDIPNQTINEGQTFTTITLDNYVSDVDNTDAEMTWTYSGNTELIVDITNRIATITTPNADWNGSETITFRATDPGLLWSEDPATFTANPINDPPTLVDSVTAVSLSPVNRAGGVTTDISATFTDVDEPAVSVFNVTFKIRYPNNITELTLVNNQPNGGGGLTIVDNGGGSYTASYTYNPDDAQTIGLYDLYFEVTDGSTPAIDNYDKNLDELEINEVANQPPVVTDIPNQSISEGSIFTTITLDNYVSDPDNTDAEMTWTYSGNTELTVDITNRIATITTPNADWNGSETITFRATDPGLLWAEDAASFTVTPVNDQPLVTDIPNQTILAGESFATITLDNYVSDVDNTDSEMTWTYSGNTELTVDITNRIATITPPSAEWTGSEVITFRATDPGLLWYDDPATFTVQPGANNAPTIAAGNTSVNPVSLARVGAATTEFSVDFTDTDAAGINDFTVIIKIRAPFSQGEIVIADSITHGVGGLTITDNGGGSYTATITWDPPETTILGYYDLYTKITDGISDGEDLYSNNSDELLINNTGENAPPVVQADATTASPAGIERVGANSTTISTIFQDGDSPGVNAFTVNYKLRKPDNLTDTSLVTNATNGTQGLTISDGGGGIYTASISWDPPDGQEIGLYDIYFDVTDGSADTSYDNFASNADEIEVFDAAVNNNPTVVAGNTFVLPDSISRIGTDFIMIKSTFADADFPGIGAFSITIKVQDPSSSEYTIVNAASNGLQGLKVVFNGTDYEASVLWDPPDVQATGLYDLYFFVDDNNGGTIADGYASNSNELNITDAVPLGDGNLLRRTLDDGMCGGSTSACHNISTHASQTCLTCHTPHGSPNIYLIRDTIATPTLGNKEVIFKTVGVGDPYNDPDPVEGDNNHGAMADDSNTVQTEICEVCHVEPTKYYRGDDSHTLRKHNNIQNCVASCHPHDAGFTPSGGGESSGGDGCGCHSTIVTQLTTSTTTYHHQLTNDNANYSAAAKTCLQCHVHHDIFRDDLNSGVGAQRAKNLRVSINTTPVQGDGTVFLNSDYQSTGDGGICLSCHTSTQTKGYTQPDGTTETPAISKTGFDASTAHNYNATSSFGDGSSFNANCVKCHNDEMSKSRQTSTVKFSTHDSQYRRILDATGVSSPADPLEEDFCFSCHSTTSNPYAGSNMDKYNVTSMTSTSLAIETAFGRTYGHPTIDSSGVHAPGESSASDYQDGNRHAECTDCHNPHVAQQGTHDGTTNLVSNALKGTWGVEPTYGTAPTPTNNANVFSNPTGYTVVNPAEKEYQICLKCHSNYTTLPSGSRNLAEELNPAYPSTHAILQAGDNTFCNSTTMNEPWGTNKINYCSDCHRSDTSTDPEGPHGSNAEHLLVATIVSNNSVGTPLCDVCHKSSVYWSGSATPSDYDDHPATQGQHYKAPGCFSCHMWDHASTAGLGLPTDDWPGTFDNTASVSPPIKIWVHGQNRKWVYNEQDGTTTVATGQPVENFINGYIANMNHSTNRCWTETCKVHSDKAY